MDQESDVLRPDLELTSSAMLNHDEVGGVRNRGHSNGHVEPLISESEDADGGHFRADGNPRGEALASSNGEENFSMNYDVSGDNKARGGEEEIMSRKEDDWISTIAGVSGNVLEW